ncbi:MAG: PEP-utilizing enzyme [Chloroflexota bacterium]|nr:PEP-utilizing enzyme [Chloroflexota bacterium]
MLALVGGKGGNLGEMTSAGLSVPPGFCITMTAYTLVAAEAGLDDVLNAYAARQASNAEELARAARACLLQASLPGRVTDAIVEAYRVLGAGEPIPVAVRSSATAEDLPFASFAGQQDTFLNVIGVEAVLDAVRRSFASLWTDRAVSYRESLGLDQRSVQLAVVVQRMVASVVAGVLFTANPLTGKRRQAVIDANPGLGEAVVSGATNPDHFVVTTASGEIVERRLGEKQIVISGTASGGTVRTEGEAGKSEFCLSDEQIRTLAELGARVEAHYGTPQDIEWAIDGAGKLWLTQTRPITTLYPLPANAPDTDEALRVYFSLNVFQGVYRPFTPMGISAFRLMGSAFAKIFGLPPRDFLSGPPVMVDAGSRIFLEVTLPLRTSLGRTLVIGAARFIEARSAGLFEQLTKDPRLSLKHTRRWPLVRAFLSFARKTRVPLYLLQTLIKPKVAVTRLDWLRKQLQEMGAPLPGSGASDRLNTIEYFFADKFSPVISSIAPPVIGGLGSYALASRLLKDVATAEEMRTVLRALPHNPTTEMDLEIWALAQRIRADAQAAQHLRETLPARLAWEYREGTLPPTIQQGLKEFLSTYGHRSIAEIDLGLPRWSEDPTHIFGVLTNYLQLNNPDLAPDVQFQRGAREAEVMVAELIRRAHSKGWLRGQLVRFFLKRVRVLAGLREMPKFCLVLILAQMRAMLWLIGKDLAQVGRLENAEDIFFITLQEAHAALAGEDMRHVVSERRATYDFELRRRHLPRVLLSDGTEPTAAASLDEADDSKSKGMLRGSPASPGTVTARARVILDPTGAKLEPGEILVAPSTDPGWTPLFLTAGGLVMEMGGMMSHGSVVAREYGIPAVVGVAGATERITTGQSITVDGNAGKIVIEGYE